ncbi:MAG: hypothetical protein KGQ49_00190 [Verrucomicrobia bacterium]|nr:hypothetical protein [Verrucomicrobiota bacterium]MBU6445798.1 hypothetical protein [Verrucomicrobiota bacterium]
MIQQEAADLACSVALGGVNKKPDTQLHERLKQAPLILLSLDFDDPGKKRYSFWMRQYPQSSPLALPFRKKPRRRIDPGSYTQTWIKKGLNM